MSAAILKRQSLKGHLAAHQLKQAQRENDGLRKQLAQTVAALDRARAARPVRYAPGRRRGKVRGDLVRVLIPDTHGASADPAALRAVFADIKALDPHEIILLGDHVDCGGFLAQHHTLGYVAQADYSYEEDIAHAAALLNTLADVAPRARLDYIEGNHEHRVEDWCITQTLRHARDGEMLRRAFAPEFLLDLAGRGIRYYRQGEFYDDLPVPGIIRRGKCYFAHGFTTAKHATAMAQVKTAGNIVFGHTHRAQSDITRRLGVGVVGAWNPGCLCALQPLWNHTNPTEWTHGYAVQHVAPSGEFLHLNVPIIAGKSHLTALFKR
jgi:predicted phosphodiesterase